MNETYHCVDGDGSQGCKRCQNGYYLNGTECSKCDESCKYCNKEAKRCLECASGYYYSKPDGTSFECKKIDEHCAVWDRAGCIQCKIDNSYDGRNKPGYFIEQGKSDCSQCDAKCSVCEEKADKCLYCVDGNLLTKHSTEAYTTCKPMKEVDSNCKRSIKGFCVECETNYELNADLKCISSTK